jgi:PadR family transcriptional regulator, regulatory protein PadR
MSKVPFRATLATRRVLEVLMGEPTAEVYGLTLGERAGLPSGTVHPILARLEAAGWVSSRWEDVDPAVVARPRRRYYRLTGEGAAGARELLAPTRRLGSSTVWGVS